MGLISHRVQKNDIVEGDHIYTWRVFFAYSHHGIYVGRNKVVHFTREQPIERREHSSLSSSEISSSSSPSSSICSNMPDCGFKQPDSGVVLSCLDCFLATGSIYRFEYKVSPSAFFTKIRGGTCTTAESDIRESVIHRAMCLLQNGFGKYNVFMNNCEDFAMYCKTGLLIMDEKAPGRSGQAASAISAPLSAIFSSSVNFFMPYPIAVATSTAAMYSVSRYAADIGVRSDVVKVPVEDMGSFHGWKRKKSDKISEEDTVSCEELRQSDYIRDDGPTNKRRRCF